MARPHLPLPTGKRPIPRSRYAAKQEIPAKSDFCPALKASFDAGIPSSRRTNAGMDINSESPMGGNAGTTVLIVEDDPSLRLLCRVNLELERHHVLEADTLARARELLDSESIDVVLLDLHVGDEHGFELLPYIRKVRPNAAVCLLTGTCETDPDRPEGVQGFIRKPFELEDLTGTVQRLLAREPARP